MRIIFLVFFCVAVSMDAVAQKATLADFVVEVNFSVEDIMFPPTWIGGSVDARATKLDSAEYGRSNMIVFKALKKYPVDLVKKHLKRVHVVSTLEYYLRDHSA